MKKGIIIVSAFLTLLITGAFHGINKKSEEVETVTAKQPSMNQFPDPRPNVIPDPMVAFPVY
jgi:hypothetical protein